jgi:hypothetical protein
MEKSYILYGGVQRGAPAVRGLSIMMEKAWRETKEVKILNAALRRPLMRKHLDASLSYLSMIPALFVK